MATPLSPMATTQRSTPFPFAAPPSPQISTRPRPGFSVQSPTTGHASTTQGTAVPTFKAPAHKHAHHLHSIPPREKSTRTLILDHLLWVHARTRFQQARAELGMTVGVDIVSESEESPGLMAIEVEKDRETDDQDQLSDGEDILKVKFGAKDQERNERSPTEDEHGAHQNLSLAQSLRLRADGVEKVLIAMLDQPPEVQPPYSDDDAPRTPPAIHGVGELHFPNGVRLRLALSTLVNDLFARDAPTPLSPRSSNTPAFQARNVQTPTSTPQVTPTSGSSKAMPTPFSLPPSSVPSKDHRSNDEVLENGLPTALAPLAAIASFSLAPDRASDHLLGGGTSLPSISSFTRSTINPTTDTLPPIISPGTATSQTPSQVPRPRRATGRVLTLYDAGADPSTANSPPSLRCPRHLHHACTICAPAKLPPMTAGSGPSMYVSGASPKSPIQTRAAFTLGSNGKSRTPGLGAMAPIPASGLAPWNSGAGIGAGLAKPGVDGTVLRRRTISHHTTSHPLAKDAGPCSAGGKLADLIPRFIRLSALVAVELGREAKDKEDEAARFGDGSRRPGPSDASSAGRDSEDDGDEDTAGLSGLSTRASALKSSSSASPYLLSLSFRPTREWYAILTGLLTRAVLEGYLSRGWKGPQGMECLLGVGLGLGSNLTKVPAEDEFSHLDPDDCPSLLDAGKILFPNLCKQNLFPLQRRDRLADGPEFEYEAEMLERISEFLTVPSSTPDLSTHFEDLAYRFPAEPVERAIVRFCEAVASWRGLPELENYKKKSGQVAGGFSAPQTMTQRSIDSLVQSASGTLQSVAALPKPLIDRYFVAPPPPPPPTGKRRRSNTTSSAKGSEHRSKKTHFETDEWTGPYGV